MRILFNTKPLIFRKTGIGYYISNLYRELIDAGVEVVPTVETAPGRFLGRLSAAAARMRRIMGERYPTAANRLGDFLIRTVSQRPTGRQYDLYHETSIDAMPDTGLRSVCNLYDLAVFRFPDYFPEGFAAGVSANLLKNVGAAHRVIVNTSFIREEAVEMLGLSPESIDVIPLVPSPFYRTDEPAAISSPSVNHTEKPYVLYVGTVEPRKNLKTLILAFKKVRARHDIALIIAGGLGWRYDDILSYPDAVGVSDVVFTRHVDEAVMTALYRKALVSVYPSLYEGFGLPPLEAMACGTPVIVSAIPTLQEVSGNAALYFQPLDAEELADCIERVISSEELRTSLIERGLQRVGGYSWPAAASMTIDTYRKAIAS